MKWLKANIDVCIEASLKSHIHAYQRVLKEKYDSMDAYMAYVQKKKMYVAEYISRITFALESKYIEMVEQQHMNCARISDHHQIEALQHELNQFESHYAKLEEDLVNMQRAKLFIAKESDFIERMRIVA